MPAFAAGFEKSIPWSGRYGGMGGNTAAVVEGAQSLAFNPAGLASGAFGPETPGKFELSLQFSPTFSQFRGPISTPQQLTSETGFSPLGAVLLSYRPVERFGIGLGGFVVGGTNADYKNVDFSAVNPNFDTLKPEFKSYVRIIDLSVGAAYELGDGLRIGAGYRISLVGAELDSANPVPAPPGSAAGTPPVALVAARLTELTDTSYSGFRVGLQYAPKSLPFSVGVAWRSPIDFTVKGKSAGSVESGTTAGPSADLPGSDATVSAALPSQIMAGLSISPIPHKLMLVGEYDFTNYSVNRALRISGSLQSPTGPIAIPNIPLDWENQHNVRVGAEWSGLGPMAVRAGYVWTSQVTATDRARATLAIPGSAHTFTAGTGGRVNEHLALDGAFEFSIGRHNGTNEFGIPGTFEERGWVAHLGGSWVF